MKKLMKFRVLETRAIVHRLATEEVEILGQVQRGDEITLAVDKAITSPSKWFKTTLPNGMAGWVSGKIVDQSGSGNYGFIPECSHYMNEHLQIEIVHQGVENVTYESPIFDTRTYTKWDRTRQSFTWEITRPTKTDKERLSTQCPYCNEKLEADIYSTDFLARSRDSYSERDSRQRKKGAIVFLTILAVAISLIALFILDPIPRGWMVFVSIFLFIAAVICLLSILSGPGPAAGPLGGSVYVEKSPIEGPRDGHYMVATESY
jgi:hypothetical protein